MINRLVLTCFFALTLNVCALAQDEDSSTRRVTMTLASGSVALSRNPESKESQQPFAPTKGNRPPVQLTVVSVDPLSARPSRRRHIEYSEDQIVVVGLSNESTELTRFVMIDPRLIRPESLRGESDIESKRLLRPSVRFSVSIDDPSVVAIRILQPVWDGNDWSFEVIAESELQ